MLRWTKQPTSVTEVTALSLTMGSFPVCAASLIGAMYLLLFFWVGFENVLLSTDYVGVCVYTYIYNLERDYV